MHSLINNVSAFSGGRTLLRIEDSCTPYGVINL